MPHRQRAIQAALAAGLAATALVVPAPQARADAPAERSAVAILAGAAPTTVTVPAVGTPYPPQPPERVSPCTFAVPNQPHPSVDQHATPAGGPSAPSLLLLGQLLPRSDLPTGRTTQLDPRPA